MNPCRSGTKQCVPFEPAESDWSPRFVSFLGFLIHFSSLFRSLSPPQITNFCCTFRSELDCRFLISFHIPSRGAFRFCFGFKLICDFRAFQNVYLSAGSGNIFQRDVTLFQTRCTMTVKKCMPFNKGKYGNKTQNIWMNEQINGYLYSVHDAADG